MITLQTLRSQKGATLIEAMIAIVILTIGILTVMVMQVRAFNASTAAMDRTDANNVVLSLLETLKDLPFTHAALTQTQQFPATLTNLNTVTTAPQMAALIATGEVRAFTAATLPLTQQMQTLIQIPAGAAAGTIFDRSGITYQLSWAVQDNIFTGQTLNKTVRVFMTWNTPIGWNRLEMSTIKYNNVAL